MSTCSALILAVAGVAAVAASAARADDGTVERQVPAEPNGKVFVDDVAGSIVVSAWDRPEVEARARLGTDALRLSVSSDSGQTHVRIEGYDGHADHLDLGRLLGGIGGEADVTVQVPRDSQLSVTSVSADIRSTGVAGAQHLQAVSGNIDAQVFSAPVDIRTVNGDIHLKGHGQQAHISAASVSGDVRLTQAGGDVQATSISGDLQLVIQPAGVVHLRATSGDITLHGALAPDAMLDMNTVSGRIDLQAAVPAGLTYDVSSFSGDIDDCFGQQAEHVSRYGPGTRLSGTRGGGQASLRIRTLSGDISICDRAPQGR